MNYEDAIKDLLYRYLLFLEYDEENKKKFINDIMKLIKD